jgi:hypothetical protein
MSNPHQLPPPVSAKPNRRFFDSWNSSSTGHQRADNSLAGSTSWRESRGLKLSNQFGGGASGGARLAGIVGAGSEDFGKDGRLENGSWVEGAPALRGRGQTSVVEAFRVKKLGVEDTATEKAKAKVMVDGRESKSWIFLVYRVHNRCEKPRLKTKNKCRVMRSISYARTPVLTSRRKRSTKIRIQRLSPHQNLPNCLRGLASISMAAHIQL